MKKAKEIIKIRFANSETMLFEDVYMTRENYHNGYKKWIEYGSNITHTEIKMKAWDKIISFFEIRIPSFFSGKLVKSITSSKITQAISQILQSVKT